MSIERKSLTVCICTFRRPELLRRLLLALSEQDAGDIVSLSVVVADNDAAQSAQPVAAEFAAQAKYTLKYCCEPRQNIALARNTALKHATGAFVAFLDDDEFPVKEWVRVMLATMDKTGADAVLGPVRPHFEASPPHWVIAGKFCERPEYPTGRQLRWSECRTGNVVLKSCIISASTDPFDSRFHDGGEDMDFFRRMSEQGRLFVWCNEGIAYESVPAARLTRSYMLKRAMLRGKNILKHSSGPGRFIAVSLIAAPVYAALLPFTLLLGQHCFMKYTIKLCDHAGRLLALVRLNPIQAR